ncbi:hypothetical protein, partial [Paracraurococcus ruber]
EEAAGFRRGAVLPLAQRPGGQRGAQPEGREAAYATRGRLAAGALIELYRLPEGTVPEGIAAPAVVAALEDLLAEAARAPGHRQQQETARLALPEGGIPGLACAETTGLYGRENVQGLLCAGGVGGGLVRLRVTMPRRDPAPADPRGFAAAVLTALRGG